MLEIFLGKPLEDTLTPGFMYVKITNFFFRSAILIRRNVNKSGGASDRKLEILSVGGYLSLFVIFNISYWASYL